MIRSLVGWLLLVAVFVSALPWELAAARSSDSQTELAAAPAVPHQCPDPGPAGDPCGDGCLCPCCPAHAVAPPAAACALAEATPDETGPVSGFDRDLHPRDFLDRIFHPPRLG